MGLIRAVNVVFEAVGRIRGLSEYLINVLARSGLFSGYMEHIHKPGNCIVILHCMDLSAVTMAGQYCGAHYTEQVSSTLTRKHARTLPHINTHLHAHIYTYTTRTHTQAHTYTYTHSLACIHIYVFHTHTHTHTYTHKHPHTNMQVHKTHTRRRKYTHEPTDIQTRSLSFSPPPHTHTHLNRKPFVCQRPIICTQKTHIARAI